MKASFWLTFQKRSSLDAMHSRRDFVVLAGILSVCTGLAIGAQSHWSLTASSASANEDLEGSLILDADIDFVVAEHLHDMVGHIRVELRRAKIGYRGLDVDQDRVVFEIQESSQIEEGAQLIGGIWPKFAVLRTDRSFEVFIQQDALDRIRQDIRVQTLNYMRELLRERGIDADGVRFQGPRCIVMPPPAADKLKQLIESQHSRARLTFLPIDSSIDPNQNNIPPGFKVIESDDEFHGEDPARYVVSKRIFVSGQDVVEAFVTTKNGWPIVTVRLDLIAERSVLQKLSGPSQQLAVVLGDRVLTTGRIERHLPDRVTIDNQLAVDQMNRLVTYIHSVLQPAPLTLAGACKE